jgi:ATP-dependent RNA helicase DeaD
MNKFEKLGLSKELAHTLSKLGLTEPTEIQDKAIPLALAGKDLIGISATGSGKTLAFGAGIIEKVELYKGIQALILTPTRELAEQIAKVMKGFVEYKKINVLKIYGGTDIREQMRRGNSSEIIVGTPGRILDLLDRRALDLRNLKILVLDEADRMSDMGFLPDVKKIIECCPEKRQTLLFSATTSKDVGYIERRYMNKPTLISVEKYVDPEKLKQIYYNVPHHLKFSLLVHLIKKEKPGTVLVFCNTRRNVDILARNLGRNEIEAVAIHGGLEQRKRSKIMERLHSKEVDILVCTDVAARGLDIKDVTHVYNYDIPKTSEEYIHRIGRTARAGKNGLAVSIVHNKDYENLNNVLADRSIKIEEATLPEMEPLKMDVEIRDRARGRSGGRDRGRGSSRSGGFGGRSRSGGFGRSSSREGSSRENRYGEGNRRHFGHRNDSGASRGFGGRSSSRSGAYGRSGTYGRSSEGEGRSFGHSRTFGNASRRSESSGYGRSSGRRH